MSFRRWLMLLSGIVLIAIAGIQRNSLWTVVEVCKGMQATLGIATPCNTVVNREQLDGYAIVKDLRRGSHYMLVPTQRHYGIEDISLQDPHAPNRWQQALDNISLVEHARHTTIPRYDIVLAVNSLPVRTQDQLHIHIDCAHPIFLRDIRPQIHRIGSHWIRLSASIAGQHWWAITLSGPILTIDPFQELYNGPSNHDMKPWALALWPNSDSSFILLASHAPESGNGEALEDHACHILTDPGTPGKPS
jgi:CDP-diacylglycerol pyrophosphatase